MQRFPINTAQVVSIGYDEDTEVLEIEFTGSKIYQYDKVPESVFEELMTSKTVETVIQQNVNPRYAARPA